MSSFIAGGLVGLAYAWEDYYIFGSVRNFIMISVQSLLVGALTRAVFG